MTLILDSGALIALDRNERAMWRRFKAAQTAHDVPITHAGVVGQVWRGHPRQARLGKALQGIDVVDLVERTGRAAGVLLGVAGQSDVIDAAVVLLTRDGDHVVTSDPNDIATLAAAADRDIELIHP